MRSARARVVRVGSESSASVSASASLPVSGLGCGDLGSRSRREPVIGEVDGALSPSPPEYVRVDLMSSVGDPDTGEDFEFAESIGVEVEVAEGEVGKVKQANWAAWYWYVHAAFKFIFSFTGLDFDCDGSGDGVDALSCEPIFWNSVFGSWI